MKLKSYIFQIALAAVGAGVLGACEDMLEPTSEYVMYDENHLTGPSDTASSLVGLIYKLEAIGDRTNLLGEVRGDLVSVKTSADADLQALTNFCVTDSNKYNNPRDYYAIINNCNYYITHADMNAYDNRGNQIFLKEMAQVKAIRAWTYLQLALTYGKVPFYTKALLTEQDAETIGTGTESRWGIEQICDYFIEDLKPYVDTDWPTLHTVGSILMPYCYFPVEVVLGDLYLWKATYSGNREDYRNAARSYWGWITAERNSGGVNKMRYKVYPAAADWMTFSTNVGTINQTRDYYSQLFPTADGWTRDYSTIRSYVLSSQSTGGSISYITNAVTTNNEIITIIPMDSASSQGYYNQVRGLYNSSLENGEYKDFSISPSTRMFDISRSQTYCNVDRYGNVDSIVVSGNTSDVERGDLRLSTIWQSGTYNATTAGMPDRITLQTVLKLNQRNIPVYRQSDVWLRLAEALNNGGFPRFAYAILATGISTAVVNDSILAYCSKSDSAFINELNSVDNIFAEYIVRNGNEFTSSSESPNNFGIHSRGSGYSEVSPFYSYPMVDSVSNGNRINGYTGQSPAQWAQMNLVAEQAAVDSMIIDEMALETCFEGKRFFDLIRWAERYHEPEWVVGSVSKRDGEGGKSSSLRGILQNKNNWFLKWNNQIGME